MEVLAKLQPNDITGDINDQKKVMEHFHNLWNSPKKVMEIMELSPKNRWFPHLLYQKMPRIWHFSPWYYRKKGILWNKKHIYTKK